MNAEVPIVSEFQADRRVALPVLAVCATFIYLCVHFAVDWYWCLPGVIILMILTGSVSKQITVNLNGRVVCENHRLLTRWLLSAREYPLSEFDAIIYEHYDEAGDTGRRFTKVGLRHRSGKKMWIRAFPATNSVGQPKSLGGNYLVTRELRFRTSWHTRQWRQHRCADDLLSQKARTAFAIRA
jgi:hypothetical protein